MNNITKINGLLSQMKKLRDDAWRARINDDLMAAQNAVEKAKGLYTEVIALVAQSQPEEIRIAFLAMNPPQYEAERLLSQTSKAITVEGKIYFFQHVLDVLEGNTPEPVPAQYDPEPVIWDAAGFWKHAYVGLPVQDQDQDEEGNTYTYSYNKNPF